MYNVRKLSTYLFLLSRLLRSCLIESLSVSLRSLIQVGDELTLLEKKPPEKAADAEMVVLYYGQIFYYMKNRRTKEKGYVSRPYMGEKGTLDGKP